MDESGGWEVWRGSLSQGGRERPLREVMGRREREYPGYRERQCKGPVVSMYLEHLENRKKPSVSGVQKEWN